MGFNENQTI